MSLLKSRWIKALVFAFCLLPIISLVVGFYRDDLSANPVEFITHATGDWTLRFLLITLAITPVRRTVALPDLIRFRRMLGLFAFFYGVLHFTTWIWLDKFFDLHEMWTDVAKRRYITVGMAGFVLMVPLAITSTAGWIRRLGGRTWQRLHRLIYLSAVAGVIHYYWLVKSDVRTPLAYGTILLALFGWRWVATRKAPPRSTISRLPGTKSAISS